MYIVFMFVTPTNLKDSYIAIGYTLSLICTTRKGDNLVIVRNVYVHY